MDGNPEKTEPSIFIFSSSAWVYIGNFLQFLMNRNHWMQTNYKDDPTEYGSYGQKFHFSGKRFPMHNPSSGIPITIDKSYKPNIGNSTVQYQVKSSFCYPEHLTRQKHEKNGSGDSSARKSKLPDFEYTMHHRLMPSSEEKLFFPSLTHF